LNAADRRRRIEDLCHAALARDPKNRAAFMAAACGSDEALRREVEALLAHAQPAEGFPATPEALAAAALTDERAAPLVGRSLGVYQIRERLGSGGMGEVFLADDPRLGRRVAIKVLRPSQDDASARERMRREAHAAAALDHPYICKVYEIGAADGRTFIAMEYVEGETLETRMRQGLLPMRHAVEIADELAQALEEAHGRTVIHRDLKPANVMLTKHGHVKVMDFGLAKFVSSVRQAVSPGGSGASTTLTGAGARLGTPAHTSPEQAVGGPVDARSDLFALGVVLHELVTGAHPFLRGEAAETMTAILRDAPIAGPREADSVPGLRPVLQRLLAKAAADRFQTAGELRTALEGIRERAWHASDRSTEALGAIPVDAAGMAERTTFVGRVAETAELTRVLERMLNGQGGVVLIGGEPGVGKTRLARELLREGQRRGSLTVTGHCGESEGAPPFAPFIEATEQAMRLAPRHVRAAMGEQAAELSNVITSLRHTYADIPPAPQVPPDQQRQLVFSAFQTFVQRATEPSPMVVLWDDLHWADEASLQLLLHLAPRLAWIRLLVVGTYRDVELDIGRPFARTLETLLRQRLAARLSLHRLNESGVEQLLAAASGSVPPAGLAHVVFQETEGNPFFVEEVYRHLLDEGKLFDAEGHWQADLRLDALDVPEGVRLVIGRRLERLGEAVRKVLTAAAVVGRRFPLDLLPPLVDLPDETVRRDRGGRTCPARRAGTGWPRGALRVRPRADSHDAQQRAPAAPPTAAAFADRRRPGVPARVGAREPRRGPRASSLPGRRGRGSAAHGKIPRAGGPAGPPGRGLRGCG
jgi:predicted Ser/Thr protein kinase